MNRLPQLACLLTLCLVPRIAAAQSHSVTLHPDREQNPVDEKVYGHFLEHIYHSVNGGLWGELIWNRSFEHNNGGRWIVQDGLLAQRSLDTNQRLPFGDPLWRDYEFTLEARKTGGAEGFLVLFRFKSEKEFYWCNLGGWGNTAHALERARPGEQRWHIVGPRVEGRIDPDRWYRIKVRCEGARIRVSLDDRLLLEFDDPDGHRAGGVGVGTWSTQAEFRNLRVTGLDGTQLYTGMPEQLTAATVARNWTVLGTGQVALESRGSYNNQYCQRLTSTQAPVGLQQAGLWLVSGETYGGSLWVRGQAEQGLTVALRAGEQDLARQTLPAPTADWEQRSFSLTVPSGTTDGVLQILSPETCDLWIDQVSLMPRSWQQQGGFRPDLLQAIGDLRPPVIRWPGGCFASAYRWKDGIGPQHRRVVYPREIWDDVDINSFGTDEFIAMCRRVGAEPLIVVNIGTPAWNGDPAADFLPEVLAWIEYCNGPADSPWGRQRAANGHPEPYQVRYWEIDNETWHLGAEAYAREVQRFAPAMRRQDAAIKLAACGSAGYGRGGNGLAWNRVLIEQCADVVDYLSIHHYEHPQQFAQGPRDYEAFFHATHDLIAKSRNPQLKIYVSEWNAQSTDWRTGLYCGGLLNAFERCGAFLEMGGPALFLRHVSATAWDNAFINFDQSRWFPAPNYVVMKFWRDHYLPLRIDAEGDVGPLNAVATTNADRTRVVYKVVNPTDKPVGLKLTLAGPRSIQAATLEYVAPGALDARNTLDQPHSVHVQPGQVEWNVNTAQCQLPALSASVLCFQLK